MEENKEIKIKFTTVIILILVLVIIGLGIYIFLMSNRDGNVNLSSTNLENNIDGQDKVLSLIESLNINKEFYKKEKVEVNDERDIGNGESLTLKEYAYDDEILIVNFIYKANSDKFDTVCLQENVDKLLGLGEDGGGIPVYNINFKSVKQDNNYYICNVYDMSKLNIEEDKINLTIMDVYNYGEFDGELNGKINEKFMLDVSKNKDTSEVYSLDSNVIEIDLKELEKKNKIDTDAIGNAEFEIGKIVESNLATLIQFNSNFDLGIITEIIDNDTYTSTNPSYSFEIINENGKILNTRDDQKLALSMDAKSQILIINSLNNSKSITIKVYEDVTNTLLAKKQIDIEKKVDNAINNTTENDGIPISLEDKKIKEIAEKFHFETAVQASIYKTGNFNLNNIPNDLILRMAWDKLGEEDVTLDFGDGANTETATQKVMNKSVENIFGKSIKYKDASFENVVSKTFDGYNLNKGTISYSNGIYTADYLEGGGGSIPYIYQKAQKAIEYYGDRIEIYVKTAFINPKDYDEEKDDWIDYIYSDYDFNTETFKNEILKISESELHKENQYSYGYPSITITDNKNMDSIENKLDTYVYTFSIDNSTGDYYLSGFNKIEK